MWQVLLLYWKQLLGEVGEWRRRRGEEVYEAEEQEKIPRLYEYNRQKAVTRGRRANRESWRGLTGEKERRGRNEERRGVGQAKPRRGGEEEKPAEENGAKKNRLEGICWVQGTSWQIRCRKSQGQPVSGSLYHLTE